MEIGQNIFSKLWKLYYRVERAVKDEPAVLFFSEVKPQLEILAGLLTEEALNLQGFPENQTLAGNILAYPEQVPILGKSVELTHLALVYRTAFLITSRELGYGFNTSQSLLQEELAVLLAVNSVRDRMAECFPAAKRIELSVAPHLLQDRAKDSSPRASPLEPLVRYLLGAQHLDFARGESWLERACKLRVDSGSELLLAAGELEKEVLFYYPRAGSIRLAPVLLWGLSVIVHSLPPIYEEGVGQVSRAKTTFETKLLKGAVRKQVLLRKPENPLFHSFEKTETVEDFEGEATRAQSTEDLKDEAEALQDLNLGYVIRTNESTSGLLKGELIGEGADLQVNSKMAPSILKPYTYKEWNWKTRTYKHNWCSLFEDHPSTDEMTNQFRVREVRKKYRIEIAEIRRQVITLLSRRKIHNRQLEGSEIDIESVIERYADLRAGFTPPDRLYCREARRLRDIAVMLLFDTSLSTDGWLDGNRILDLEIDAILVLAEVFDGLLDRQISIAHFHSHTRSHCSFALLKKFTEGWSRLRSSIGDIEPNGYTRIGPGIRHAAELLARTKARERFIILVTDGKPTDYDQYEGIYGREDVAQAIREARQLQVNTFGLAIERETKKSLANMFGTGRYRTLPRISRLPSVMAEVFVRLLS